MSRRVLATISIAAGLLLAVLPFLSDPKLLPLLPLAIILVGIGIVTFFFGQHPDQPQLAPSEVNDVLGTLPTILQVIIDKTAPPGSDARAFVFVVDENNAQLKFVTAEYKARVTDEETKLSFSIERGEEQGFVGAIYEKKKTLDADLSENGNSDAVYIRLEPNQYNATHNFRSIWGCPILIEHQNRSRVIGVLTIDSPFPLKQSGLWDNNFQKEASYFTEQKIKPYLVVLQKYQYPKSNSKILWRHIKRLIRWLFS